MAGNVINKIKLTPVDVEARKKLDFKAGDSIRVWSKIAEEKAGTKKGEKSTIKYRLQAFEGLVLARKHGKEAGATFTVRKVASGVGVERIFPLFAPTIEKIEITKRASARRSKLYYIRNKAVKDVRKRLRAVAVDQNQEKEEMVSENTAE
jgi:large subunit ribosomal protein L19